MTKDWIDNIGGDFPFYLDEAPNARPPRFPPSLKDEPADAAEACRRGQECFTKKSYENAWAFFAWAVKKEPGNAGYWQELAGCFTAMKYHKRAEEAYSRAAGLDHLNPVHWDDLARAQFNRGDYEAAAGNFEQALALAPDNALYLDHLGKTYLKIHRYDDARDVYLRATARAPDDAALWDKLGNACQALNRHEEAAAALRQAIAAEPGNAGYWQALGRSFWNRGVFAPARDAYLRACEIKPDDAGSWIRLGEICGSAGDHETAVMAYEKNAALKPHDSVGWNNLGVAYFNAGDAAKGEKALRRSLALNKNADTVWRNFAGVCRDAGDYAGAGKAFREINARHWSRARDEFGTVCDDKIDPATKPVVLSATVDLKLTPGGAVKICEFNNLWASGFTGFARAAGLDMKQARVRPYYRALEAGWKQEGLPWSSIRAPYAHPDLPYLAAAVATGREKPVYANADPGFEAVCLYKDYAHLVTPDAARPYFPRTLALPLTVDRGFTADEIRRAFGGDAGARLVLKPCDGLQGNGVEVLAAAALPARLAEIAARYRDMDGGGDDYWDKNLHPNVVVQEYAPSVPVQADNGLWYNGTMRVAFTAVLDPQQKTPPQIEFHGAYWKLPPRDCSTGDSDESAISCCHTKLTDVANAAFAARPISAAVSDEHRLRAEAQLQDCLTQFLPAATASPEKLFGMISGMLEVDEPWLRALGTRLATDSIFGNLMVLANGERETRRALREKLALNTEAGPSDDAGSVFLRHVKDAIARRDPHNIRQLSAALGAAEYVVKKPLLTFF